MVDHNYTTMASLPSTTIWGFERSGVCPVFLAQASTHAYGMLHGRASVPVRLAEVVRGRTTYEVPEKLVTPEHAENQTNQATVSSPSRKATRIVRRSVLPEMLLSGECRHMRACNPRIAIRWSETPLPEDWPRWMRKFKDYRSWRYFPCA